MKPILPLLISLIGILETSAVQATCYFPNGRDMNALERTDEYQPCNTNSDFSMCCAPWDECRPDGLCASSWDGNVWRDGCTDPTWKSPSCIKLCDTGLGQYHIGKDLDLTANTFTVTPCNDGSFCCGNGTIGAACCNQNRGLFLVNGAAERKNPISLQTSLQPSTSSSTKTEKSKTSSSTTPPPSSSTASSSTFSISPEIPAFTAVSSSPPITLSTSSSDASSTGKKNSSTNIGAIVGGVVGGVAVVVLMIIAALLWKRQRQTKNRPSGHELFANEKPPYVVSEAPSGYRGQELEATNPFLMNDPSRIRHEAP